MSSPAAESTDKIPLPPARASSGMPASSMETSEAGATLKIFPAPVSMENLSRSDKVYVSKKETLPVWFTQGFLSNIPKPNYFLL